MSPARMATTKAEVERLKRERISRLATISAWVGLVVAVATLVGTIYSPFSERQLAGAIGPSRLEQAEKLAVENAVIKEKLAALSRQVGTLMPSAGVTPTSAELAKLNEEISELAKRQRRIEDAISRDPARALEVPLLRKDVDNIKERQVLAEESMSQRIDQIFELNKWLLGGGAVSLFAIALSILLSRLKARAEA